MRSKKHLDDMEFDNAISKGGGVGNRSHLSPKTAVSQAVSHGF